MDKQKTVCVNCINTVNQVCSLFKFWFDSTIINHVTCGGFKPKEPKRGKNMTEKKNCTNCTYYRTMTFRCSKHDFNFDTTMPKHLMSCVEYNAYEERRTVKLFRYLYETGANYYQSAWVTEAPKEYKGHKLLKTEEKTIDI